MIPMIMKLYVHSGRFRMKLWIPLILVYLLMLPLLLLLLPFIAIAWIAAAIRGWRIPLFRLLALFVELLGTLRKTEVRVVRPAANSEFEIAMM